MCLSLIRVCSITRRIATLQNMYSLSRNGPARRTRAKPSGNGSLTKRGFVPFSYLSKTTKIHVFLCIFSALQRGFSEPTASAGEFFSYDTAQGPDTTLVVLHIYTKVRALRAR